MYVYVYKSIHSSVQSSPSSSIIIHDPFNQDRELTWAHSPSTACLSVCVYICTSTTFNLPYQIMFDKYIWIHILHCVNQSTNQCVRIYFIASGSVRLFVHACEQQQITKDRETTNESQSVIIHHNSSVTQITPNHHPPTTINQLWMDRNRKNIDEPILPERWHTSSWYMPCIEEIWTKLEYRADIHEERYVFVQNDVYTRDM